MKIMCIIDPRTKSFQDDRRYDVEHENESIAVYKQNLCVRYRFYLFIEYELAIQMRQIFH